MVDVEPMHELIMHEAVFAVVKRFLESNYPLQVFHIPPQDPDANPGIISHGVAPTTDLLPTYSPHRQSKPLTPDTKYLSEWTQTNE